jgi:hypothetical protein
VFEGVLTSGVPSWTVSRGRLIKSSSGSIISLSGAAKQIFACEPAELLGPLLGRLNTVTTTNSGNAFTATYDVDVPAWINGLRGKCRMNAAPTGAATLTLVSPAGTLVAKSIKTPLGANVISGAWKIGYGLEYRYDATDDVVIWTNAPDAAGVKTVSTATYTVLAEDYATLLRFTNAAGCLVTLPQATATGSFAAPFFVDMVAGGGTVVVVPTTSTIDGAAILVLAGGNGAHICSDSSNYATQKSGAFAPSAIGGLLPTSIAGTNTTASLTVTAGSASDSTNATILGLSASQAWAVSNGNAANGYQGGTTLPNSSTIHFFICAGTSGTCIFASTSLTPTPPSGYASYYRRIFSIQTNASGALIAYTAIEAEGGSLICLLSGSHPVDVNGATPTSANRTLYPLSIPSGAKHAPMVRLSCVATSSNLSMLATSPDEPDVTVTVTATDTDHTMVYSASYIGGNPSPFLLTNTSGQIGIRASGTNGAVNCVTRGWKDFRR